MECGKVRCETDRGHARPKFETSKAPTKKQLYFYKCLPLKLNVLSKLVSLHILFVMRVSLGLWSVAAYSTESPQDQRSISAYPTLEKITGNNI